MKPNDPLTDDEHFTANFVIRGLGMLFAVAGIIVFFIAMSVFELTGFALFGAMVAAILTAASGTYVAVKGVERSEAASKHRRRGLRYFVIGVGIAAAGVGFLVLSALLFVMAGFVIFLFFAPVVAGCTMIILGMMQLATGRDVIAEYQAAKTPRSGSRQQ